jgi:hypothetical protein
LILDYDDLACRLQLIVRDDLPDSHALYTSGVNDDAQSSFWKSDGGSSPWLRHGTVTVVHRDFLSIIIRRLRLK